ncbi:lectin-like protein, partial [Salmonella sp. s54836]|uniref:lectin-like protein n=1 Tax=Salmonella sp. s54836 TaxID=3159673 RepID=UPI00398027E6
MVYTGRRTLTSRVNSNYFDRISDAENNCIAWGGHLVTITSPTENTRLGSITTSFYDTWIGLNDIANERNYVWVDGSTSSYRNWYDQAHFSFNDCASMTTGSGSYRWNDMNCVSKFASLCSQSIPVSINAPESLMSTDIGANRITVSWDSTSLLNIQYYVIATKSIGEKTSYTTLSPCITSYSIQQLTSRTAYTITLYACSSTCCNNRGAVIAATTTSQDTTVHAISNLPKNLTAAPINESAIIITWDTPCNDLLLTILNYRVMYAQLGSAASIWTTTVQASTTAYTNYTTVISG